MTLDWSLVAFEFLNFGVLVAILWRFLFRPVEEALNRRRAELSAGREQVKAREEAAAALQGRYEAQLADLEQVAREQKAEALRQGQSQAEQLVDEARAEARRLVDNAHAELHKARKDALAAIRGELFVLASQAAAQVIRDMAAPEVACGYARRAVAALAATEPKPAGPPIRVQVSPDVDMADIERILREGLGDAQSRLAFERDPTLVAGVRLWADNQEIESSAGASLRAWYERWLAGEGAQGHAGSAPGA